MTIQQHQIQTQTQTQTQTSDSMDIDATSASQMTSNSLKKVDANEQIDCIIWWWRYVPVKSQFMWNQKTLIASPLWFNKLASAIFYSVSNGFCQTFDGIINDEANGIDANVKDDNNNCYDKQG